MSQYAHKKLIVFDLDRTLTPSKTPLEESMAHLLGELLARTQIAVMSGGSREQLEKQFVSRLPREFTFERLYLLPTCGASLYQFGAKGWHILYTEAFTGEEKRKIVDAFTEVFPQFKELLPEEVFGDVLEDRGTQITFSALGQNAPRELKEKWDPDFEKRRRIQNALVGRLSEFEVMLGGSTSIDVNRKGIDKAYGIRQIEKRLGIARGDMLFVGDALFPGGNDWPVKEAGVECIAVDGPEETKKIIRSLIGD